MSIMDLFRQTQQPQSAQPQQAAPIQQQSPAPEQTPVQPTGLDAATAWFTPAKTDAKPSEFDPAALFATTPEAQQALQAEVGKLNFMDGAASPEMIQAIQGGGEDAIKVLPALMNKVAQNAFSAALKASMQISQTAFAKAAPAIDGKMNDVINRRRISEAVTTANPVLSHPSGKIIADALIDSFSKKYPTASETELKELANKYITDISAAGVPAQADPKNTPNKMDTDWGSFWAAS